MTNTVPLAGDNTVNARVALWVRPAEAPVIVTVAFPAAADEETVNVIATAPPEAGTSAAVTPFGNPAADKETVPVKPPTGATEIRAAAEAP